MTTETITQVLPTVSGKKSNSLIRVIAYPVLRYVEHHEHIQAPHELVVSGLGSNELVLPMKYSGHTFYATIASGPYGTMNKGVIVGNSCPEGDVSSDHLYSMITGHGLRKAQKYLRKGQHAVIGASHISFPCLYCHSKEAPKLMFDVMVPDEDGIEKWQIRAALESPLNEVFDAHGISFSTHIKSK